jgi:hypothetical protein
MAPERDGAGPAQSGPGQSGPGQSGPGRSGAGEFSPGQVESLATGASFLAEPGERECPACGCRSLRAYVNAPEKAKRPTLVSYVWCRACRRFVGSRAKHPAGLIFSDPLAALSAAERRTLVGFLAYLDRLWDDGVLPQSFATG